MGTFQVASSCSQEYRAKQTWLPKEKYKFLDCYTVAQRRQRRYAQHADERQLAQMRKDLVSVLVEIVIEDDRAVQNEVAVDASTLKQKFLEQAEKWDNETAHLSSPAQRFLHPSYVAVMGMAQDHRDEVIRLMLRDMEDNHREWFWALSYLTHDNPIERRDSGNLDKMIRAWVRWGKQKGLR